MLPASHDEKLNLLTALVKLAHTIHVWHATCSLMCWLDSGTGIGQSKKGSRLVLRLPRPRGQISRILEMLKQQWLHAGHAWLFLNRAPLCAPFVALIRRARSKRLTPICQHLLLRS